MPGVRLSLRKNFTWTFAGNAIYAASQWGQLVVLAKLGSPETVGQFALALAICAPVIMFANLQLRSVQATDARHEYAFADYLGLRLMTTAAAYLVIISIVVLSGYQRETALAILCIGISKCFEAVSDVIFGLLQQQERMDRIAKSLMIEGPLTLVVMTVVLFVTHSIVWATGSLAVVWGLQLAFYDIPSALMILRAQSPGDEWKLMRPRFDFKRLRPLVWLALPLGLAGSLNSLNTNIPRYFIQSFLGEQQLGIFAASAYFILIGAYVISALGQSASPRLAHHYQSGDFAKFRRLRNQLIGLGALLGAIGILVVWLGGGFILNFAYGSKYAQQADVLLILMIASALQYTFMFLGTTLNVMRRFQFHAYIQTLSIGMTVLLSIILIKDYGIRGAAYAILIKTFIEGVAYFLVVFFAQYNLARIP